jgi:hypothetical protein
MLELQQYALMPADGWRRCWCVPQNVNQVEQYGAEVVWPGPICEEFVGRGLALWILQFEPYRFRPTGASSQRHGTFIADLSLKL